MKKKNKLKLVLIIMLLLVTTGCTQTLKGKDKKVVTNPETGQSLTKNILCRPSNDEVKKTYEENGVDLKKLPECKNFTPASGGYEGIWDTIFVKPLAFVILWISRYVGSAGLALIITSIALRLLLYPITNKTALQSELIKQAQPELDRLEKKYKDKTDQDAMMKKANEMTMIYKKYNINPISGCLYGFLQLPLFIAFLEAINRVPALFEETFIGLQLGTTPSIGLFSQGNWIYLILLVLVGVSTYYSFNLNTVTPNGEKNPMANMTNVMSIMIIVMAIFMPAALCIYWIATNLFTIGQNLIVKRSRKAHGKA